MTLLHVLVVEDDASFREMYERLLRDLGFTHELATNRKEAKTLWDADAAFDVVLLDQRLQTEAAREDGIDLLDELRFSSAKVIVVTGYATDDAVRRAFALGAHDYLEKSATLPTLLTVKLDQIRETRRLRQRGTSANETIIDELWQDLGKGTANERGRRLEELVLRLMTSIPGLHEVSRNLRIATEELDVVIRNESTDKLWEKQPAYFVCEAKNWSQAVGTPQIGWFADKLRDRREQALGFFFAPGGFSEPVEEKVRSYRKEGLRMVCVDRDALRDLVEAEDRSESLKKIHARWAMA